MHECLKSVEAQTYRTIEVLVIDNYSKDSTKDIAKKHGATLIQCLANRSEARNIGFNKSNGDFLIFVDSDMMLTQRLIEECLSRTIDKDALIIPEICQGEGFCARCRKLEKSLYIGDPTIEACRFFSRDAFEKICGYDPLLVAGEDWDLQRRVESLQLRIGRTVNNLTHVEGKLSLSSAVLRKYKYGLGLSPYILKNSRAIAVQLNPISRLLVMGVRGAKEEPSLALGLVILKSFEFAAGTLGYVKSLFQREISNRGRVRNNH